MVCYRFEDSLAPIRMAKAQLTMLPRQCQHCSATRIRWNPITPPLAEYCGLFLQPQKKETDYRRREIPSLRKNRPLLQSQQCLLHFAAGNSHRNTTDTGNQKRGTMQIKSLNSCIRNHASCNMGNYIVHTVQNSQQKVLKIPLDFESMVGLYLLTVPWQHNSRSPFHDFKPCSPELRVSC